MLAHIADACRKILDDEVAMADWLAKRLPQGVLDFLGETREEE